MSITFDKNANIFYLETPGTSYIMGLYDERLLHLHWGKKIDFIPSVESAIKCSSTGASIAFSPNDLKDKWSTNNLPMEFPTHGSVDFRTPAFHAIYEDGSAELPPERQRETAHRYILGLYYVLETLTTKFDNILFESCSGGGRFDAGMLYYMPQTWTSDDSDAIERCYIQYGTSVVYPAITMGAHVSAVPNHQVGRTTSMKTRCDVAIMGQFGFELDLNKLSDEDIKTAADSIVRFKEIRETVQFGDMYRLMSPFDSSFAIWEFVSKDKKEVVVISCSLTVHVYEEKTYKLQGLDEKAVYTCKETGVKYSGIALMNLGLFTTQTEDFKTEILTFTKD